MRELFEEVSCIVCRGAGSTLLERRDSFGLGQSTLRQCLNCGLLYYSPRLNRLALERIYSGSSAEYDYSQFYNGQESGRRQAAERMKKISSWYGERPGRLLDVGCGYGIFVEAAAGCGWDAHGVEKAGPVAELARSEFQLQVYEGDIGEVGLPDGHFDLIAFHHCLEHLSDPGMDLAHAWRLLRDGGMLVIRVPNINSVASRLAGRNWLWLGELHLYHFSRRTLTRLLDNHGFDVIHSDSGPGTPANDAARSATTLAEKAGFGRLVSTLRESHLSPALARVKSFARRCAFFAWRLLLPLMWISWRLGWGEELTVYARKRQRA